MKAKISITAGFLLGGALLFLAFRNIDFGRLVEIYSEVNPWYIIPFVLTILLEMLFRSARWRLLLNPSRPVRLWDAFRLETAGKALSSAAAKPAGPVYDAELARRLAQAAADGNAGAFGGKCYAYVAWHMHHAGILDFNGWVDMGIQPGYSDDAADFFVWADQNREKMRSEMRLAIVPTPASKEEVPVGSILVYDRGWCGFSESSGHIEVLTSPDWACSDGCESLDNNCFADASIREHVHVIIPVKN